MLAMKRATWLVGALVVAAVAAGIGIWVWEPGSGPSVASGPEAADVEVGPNAGQRAPSFRLPTLAGGEVSLADFKGQPVILEFWASWCPNCNATAPHLEAFAQQLTT